MQFIIHMHITLPKHGRVDCQRCFQGCASVEFDRTQRTAGDWRITANPLAWGNTEPEVVVLGFSKGPTQAGALASAPHDAIAYKGSRTSVGKILQHVGLVASMPKDVLSRAVDRLIADANGRFHFASLIRCTLERREDGDWKGTGGGMLDKFIATPFGAEVAGNCTSSYLGSLPSRTKLVVMFGMGSKLGYVRHAFKLLKQARGGTWRWLNEVAYTDGKIVVVHVEHFASQGALIPQWLGERDHHRSRYGRMAADTVAACFGGA